MKNKNLKNFIVIFVVASVLLLINEVEAKPVSSVGHGNNCLGECQMQTNKKFGCIHLDATIAKQIRTVVEGKDYDAWLSLMNSNSDNFGHDALLQRINSKEKFDEFVNVVLGAHEINKKKRNLKLQIHQALETGDYVAWKEAVKKRDHLMSHKHFSWKDKIQNEKDFLKMQELFQMSKKLKEKRQELGLYSN